MDMYDRRARLVGAYRRLDDLLRRDRDCRALPRYRHAAGDRRADDDLLQDLYPFLSTRSPLINVKDRAEPPQTRFVSAPRECRRLMVGPTLRPLLQRYTALAVESLERSTQWWKPGTPRTVSPFSVP